MLIKVNTTSLYLSVFLFPGGPSSPFPPAEPRAVARHPRLAGRRDERLEALPGHVVDVTVRGRRMTREHPG